MTLSKNDRVCKSAHVAQRMFDDSMLVITAKDSMLHTFDAVGTFIWNMVGKPTPVENILSLIEDSFDGFDRRKSGNQILDFLETLEKKNLIVVERRE